MIGFLIKITPMPRENLDPNVIEEAIVEAIGLEVGSGTITEIFQVDLIDTEVIG
jgi:hypothetical protein